MLTRDQFRAVQRMASFGYHLSPSALPFSDILTVNAWKGLKYQATTGEAWREHPAAHLSIDSALVRAMVAEWSEMHDATSFGLEEDSTSLDSQMMGVIHQPRCGCPDFRPAESVAEGSWHPDCRKRLTWALQGGGFALPGLTQQQVEQCFQWAYEYTSSELDGVAFVRNDSLGNTANTFSRPARLSGSTLARHTLPPSSNTSCSFRGWGEYDSDRQWSSISYLLAVIIHEEGHGLGCDHVSQSTGGIMTPGINQAAVGRVQQWLSTKHRGVYNEADWQELRRRDYRKRQGPVPPPPEEPDDPTPGDTLLTIDGRFIRVVIDGQQRPERFTVAKVPEI